ncbi:hypothetical protein ACP70R_003077 [Stipagrostis hirtigluma subsp. patula]
MYSGGGSCPRTRSGVVRVKCFMDSGSSSCSRTRSGLVRGSSIMDSSDGSCSRTRSGLVRGHSIMDSNGDSCSRTRSGLIRRKPLLAEALGKDEDVTKGIPDGCMKEDMPAGMRSGLVRGSPAVKGEEVIKGLCNGGLKEEMPSRTRSGLVRRSPTAKWALSKDGPLINGLPDGWQGEDMPGGTRSRLVRGRPAAVKTLCKDEPVIKELTNGLLKEDKPLGTRSGLVRGSPAVKALGKVEPVPKGSPDGFLKEDKPSVTRSGLIRGSHVVKALSNDDPVIEGLPDGWFKEYRPRKTDLSKNDPYYIDPFSGYEFRSMKDVHRYLQTGDINQCAMKPKKRTIYDVCITEDQPHTSTSSQGTRPRTADKAIQCEILTSEGIMLPWEETSTTYGGTDTETTMLPESENIKAMQGCANKVEALGHKSIPPVFVQGATGQTKCVKRKEPNAEVKFKKHKTSPTKKIVTPVRGSPRLAALKVQHEESTELEDEPASVNLVNPVQIGEENITDQSQMNHLGPPHDNQESSFSYLQSSQADSANEIEAMQEYTANHLQPNQVGAVSYVQTKREITANQVQQSLADTGTLIQTVQGYSTNHSQPSHADTTNQVQTNQEDTADQERRSQADTVAQILVMSGYTANEPRRNHADNMNQIPTNQEMQEYTAKESQQCHDDIMNQILTSQETTLDQLQSSRADTQMQIMQENVTSKLQISQGDQNQIHINLENTTDHLHPNHAGNTMLQDVFLWAPEQNGEPPITDFWKNVEDQGASVPMQIDGAPVASFPANVKFQNAPAAEAEPVMQTQAALPGTASDQSGFSSLFGNAWSDPCIEFAFKTLTGDIPVLDDTAAVTNLFPQQQDLNKCTTPNCSASTFDDTRNHKQSQLDVNLNLPVLNPSDKLYNGSWFPPQ